MNRGSECRLAKAGLNTRRFNEEERSSYALCSTLSVVLASRTNAQVSSGQETPGTPHQLAERIHRVETQFPPVVLGHDQPHLQLDLQRLMEMYKVPAVSVAVIDDFGLAWAKGYGMTDAGGTSPVTTRTLFQAGSISKPVVSAAALYLVEHGKLSLDEDVNRKLVSWKVQSYWST